MQRAPSLPVSVAICTRDRAEPLQRCLEAISRGSTTPAEIVLVDQSSGSSTQAVCENLRRAGTSIVYIRQRPLGLAAAQNLAVNNASSGCVAVIDDDCIADPEWLTVIAAAFSGNGSPDVVTGRVLPLPPVGDRTYAVSTRTSNKRAEYTGKSLPWPVGSGNNFALKKDWFVQIGGCDERLGPGSPGQGGVDMDLFYRLLRAGARIRYEPQAVVYHERDTLAGRLARRPMYGHGMGACCVLRLREGDAFALWILGRWFLMRSRLLASGIRRADWQTVREERLMLGGTLKGIWHGVKTVDSSRNA